MTCSYDVIIRIVNFDVNQLLAKKFSQSYYNVIVDNNAQENIVLEMFDDM